MPQIAMFSRSFAACAFIQLLVSCGADHVASVPPVPQETGVAEAIYQELCSRVAVVDGEIDLNGQRSQRVCRQGMAPTADHPAALHALHANKSRLLQAINQTLEIPTSDFASRVKAFLPSLLDLTDAGVSERYVQAQAAVLDKLLQNPQALAAVHALHAQTYLSTEPAWSGLARALIAYPHSHEMLQQTLPIFSSTWPHAALWQNLKTAWLDADDAASYHWLQESGATYLLTPHRLLENSTNPVWRQTRHAYDAEWTTQDISSTPLAGWLQVAQTLLHQHSQDLLQATATLPTWLSGCSDSSAAALLQTAATLGLMLGEPSTSNMLQLLHTVLLEHPVVITEMAKHVVQAQTWQLPQIPMPMATDANALRELWELNAELLKSPGLLEDLWQALLEPQVLRLGPLLAEQLRYTDWIDINPADINGPPVGSLHTPINQNADDLNTVFTRILSLVHDSRTPLCNKPYLDYAPCELFYVPDAGLFYLDAILGKAMLTLRFFADNPESAIYIEQFTEQLPDMSAMEWFTGIKGFTPVEVPEAVCNPPGQVSAELRTCIGFLVSPQAAARLLFATFDERLMADPNVGEAMARSQALFDEPMIDGVPFHQKHGGTLFAWELNDFFAAIRPILAVFDQHGRVDLLLQSLEILQNTWQPAVATTATEAAGLSHLAPLLAQVLDEGQVLHVVADLLQVLQQVQVQGLSGREVVAQWLRDWSWPKVGMPNGEAPGWVLLQSVWAAQACLTAEQEQAMAKVAVAGILQLADLKRVMLLATAVDWLQQVADSLRLQQTPQNISAQAVAQLTAWQQDTQLRAVLALLQAILEDEKMAQVLVQWLDYVLQEHSETVLKSLHQILATPSVPQDMRHLQKVLATAIGDETSLLALHAEFGIPALTRDEKHVITQLVGNLLDPTQGETPLQTMIAVYLAVNRQFPVKTSVPSKADITQALSTLRAFLTDDKHGMLRLLAVMKNRNAL